MSFCQRIVAASLAAFTAVAVSAAAVSSFSAGMAVFNLCVLFYNLFGRPKNYPAAKLKEKKLHRSNLRHGR